MESRKGSFVLGSEMDDYNGRFKCTYFQFNISGFVNKLSDHS